MMTKPKTNYDTYHNVPDSLVKKLDDFRENTPFKALDIGKHQWTYYIVGHVDDDALLLLHGGGGNAETMFGYIQELSQHFRVIAPNIPITSDNLDETVDSLQALLVHEGIKHANVVGFSFGAMLAQMFIRRFQDTVRNMVITHGVIPSKHLAEPRKMQRNIMRWYPEPLLRGISKQAYQKQIENNTSPASPEQRQFWQAYFEEYYSTQFRKKQIISRANITVEYHSANEFNSRDLLEWHGNMLIIESENDEVVSDGDRGSLKMMYTRAYIQTLYGYDHLAPLLAQDEMISSIVNFLLKEDD